MTRSNSSLSKLDSKVYWINGLPAKGTKFFLGIAFDPPRAGIRPNTPDDLFVTMPKMPRHLLRTSLITGSISPHFNSH